MKYCPFCGADLLGPEVSFCAECGKQLPIGVAPQTEPGIPPDSKNHPRNSKKKAALIKPKRKPQKKARLDYDNAPTERLKPQSGEEDAPESMPEDDYDGYYDDVEPMDAGDARPGLDREMIKKIIFLVLGALLVIGLCVVLMTVL